MVEFAEYAAKYGPYAVIAVLCWVCRTLKSDIDRKETTQALERAQWAADLKASQEARIKENNENGQLLATTNEALRYTHSLIEKGNGVIAGLDLRVQKLLSKEAS